MARNELVLLVVVGDAAAPPTPLAVDTKLEADPVRGQAIAGGLVPSGGAPPYSYAHTGGTLPPGTTLDVSTGELLGTPTTQGTYEFEVTVTDALGSTFAALFSLAVSGGISWVTPQDLPTAEHAIPYSMTFTATNGTPPYTFAILAGSPAGGLNLSGANAGLYIRASPNAPTITFRNTFTLRVTDAVGNYADRMFVEWTLPPLNFLGLTYPTDGLVGLPYNVQMLHQYGLIQQYPKIEPIVQWQLTSGALPPGIQLDPLTGIYSGTPNLAGTYAWTITLSDPIGASISIPFSAYIHAITDLDKIFADSFGDGLSSSFTITHGLQLPLIFPRSVVVYDVSAGSPWPAVDVEWKCVDSESIEIKTGTVPTIGQYFVVIVG